MEVSLHGKNYFADKILTTTGKECVFSFVILRSLVFLRYHKGLRFYCCHIRLFLLYLQSLLRNNKCTYSYIVLLSGQLEKKHVVSILIKSFLKNRNSSQARASGEVLSPKVIPIGSHGPSLRAQCTHGKHLTYLALLTFCRFCEK